MRRVWETWTARLVVLAVAAIALYGAAVSTYDRLWFHTTATVEQHLGGGVYLVSLTDEAGLRREADIARLGLGSNDDAPARGDTWSVRVRRGGVRVEHQPEPALGAGAPTLVTAGIAWFILAAAVIGPQLDRSEAGAGRDAYAYYRY